MKTSLVTILAGALIASFASMSAAQTTQPNWLVPLPDATPARTAVLSRESANVDVLQLVPPYEADRLVAECTVVIAWRPDDVKVDLAKQIKDLNQALVKCKSEVTASGMREFSQISYAYRDGWGEFPAKSRPVDLDDSWRVGRVVIQCRWNLPPGRHGDRAHTMASSWRNLWTTATYLGRAGLDNRWFGAALENPESEWAKLHHRRDIRVKHARMVASRAKVELPGLQQRRRDIQLEIKSKTARLQAITALMERTRKEIDDRIRVDPLVNQLEKIIAGRAEALTTLSEKIVDWVEAGAVSNMEAQAMPLEAEEKLAETRLQLAMRKEAIMAEHGGEMLSKLMTQQAELLIDQAERKAIDEGLQVAVQSLDRERMSAEIAALRETIQTAQPWRIFTMVRAHDPLPSWFIERGYPE